MELQRTYHNPRAWLLEEWTERKQVNKALSLRSFAKSLGISPATCSQVLSGKRPMGRKAALRVIERTLMPTNGANSFLAATAGITLSEIAPNPDENASRDLLPLDSFVMISDWRYFAVLGLANLTRNDASCEWISQQLGISVQEATEVFKRLVDIGFIKKRGRGFFQTKKPISVPTKPNAPIFRRFHRGLSARSAEALNDDQVAMEYFSAMFMAIDPAQLPLARPLIQDFRRKMSQILESGNRKKVFALSVQLFPLERK